MKSTLLGRAKDERGSILGGCLVLIVVLAIYIVAFWWYATNWIPRPYETDLTTFWHGLAHGFFAVPDWVLSLFYDDIVIYQTPNNGGWYDFGFLLGIGAFASGASKSA